MPGKAAVVVTAAALSVTVGVLIGIVLIIGSRARQSSVSATPPGTAVSSSEASVSGAPPDGEGAVISVQGASSPAELGLPETTPAAPAVPTPGSMGTASTTASTPAVRPTPAPRPATRSTPARPTTTRPAIVFTTVTVAPPTSRTQTPTPPSTSTPVSTTTSTTAPSTPTSAPPTTAAVNGAPAAGRPCRSLGDKATAAGGSTVYCQTDFSNGSLAWRAVVEGGGCLSKKMTGIGVDGRSYVCRPDRKGLDFWRRA